MRRYCGMTAAAAATPVLPPRAAAVAMKTPAAGSAAAPRWEAWRWWWQWQLAGSVVAWQWRRAGRQQRDTGGHGRGSCRHRRPTTALRRDGDEDTGVDSNGGGTNNLQSTKSSDSNNDGTGNNNSDNEAQAYLLPQTGRTRLPRSLGYTRLPRPVRVHSWGGWVKNRIKVYTLYYRLPQPLGYTRLPRPLGYTLLP